MMPARTLLQELMSFNDLYRVSDPKRVVRSLTVRGPPLQVDAYANALYYGFNFKANPSTTGLRHHGYVKFKKPRHGPVPLSQVPIEVDCDCPDYKFRFAWANKQKGASRVGPNSVNQAINRAPRITNPLGQPGLCKHILAVKDYIEGQMSGDSFIGNEPDGDTSNMLKKIVDRSKKIWIDYDGTMRQARDREQQLSRARQARNQGQQPPPPPPDEDGDDDDGEDSDGPDGNSPPVPPVPPTGPGAGSEPTVTMRDVERQSHRPAPSNEPPRPPWVESVDTTEKTTMKTELNKARALVEEMEADISSVDLENTHSGDCPDEDKPEGEQALDLLKSIDQSLQDLVAGGEPELPPEEGAPSLDDIPAPTDEIPPGGGMEGDEDEFDIDKLAGV